MGLVGKQIGDRQADVGLGGQQVGDDQVDMKLVCGEVGNVYADRAPIVGREIVGQNNLGSSASGKNKTKLCSGPASPVHVGV